ncbi:uncharacterized protein LOC128200052 [Galleria mellonella]|uniref:Uncharacterized protein LOC128200052 n=1 Tax=Galleria mellonella TaxID=7137 RepID=A0ABM3MA60_GALME|nr:uncharacterized protein LOC128200052 [Galleria mellonella]
MAELSDENSGNAENEKSEEINYKRIVDTRDLIAMVKRYRCLWDRRHADYKNKHLKTKAWKEIYREIEPTYDSLSPTVRYQMGLTITKKWNNVRDSFVKYRKSARSPKPYIYSNEMTFLDVILNTDEQKESNTGVDSEEGDNWMGEVFIDVDESTEEVASKRPKYDVLNVTKEESAVCEDHLRDDPNIVTFLANLIQKEEDEDRAFFKSITPAVKTLSEEAKLEFRLMVMKILKSLKKREKQKIKREPSVLNSDSE